jgi:O-antigen/teichoic acid export membrane protein
MNGILWIVLLLGYILSPIFIRVIWNNSYNESITPFLWALPGFFARAQIAMYTAFFSARGYVRLNVVASLIGLLCLLSADAFLLPGWNIKGAAIGLSIAQMITAYWMIWIFNKKEGSTSFRLFPDRRDLQRIDLPKLINRFV